MRDVSVVIGLGGNPSPLYSLVWSLTRERDVRVKSIRVVIGPRNLALHLKPVLDVNWAEFRSENGDRLPTRRQLKLIDVGREEHEDHRDEAFGERLWRAFSEATREETPVVLALGGTRHRTVASLATTIFALHARPCDRLVDVRILPKALEDDTAFLTPDHAGCGEVRVDDVPVPRLRGVVEQDADSFAGTISLGQRAIDRVAIPKLVIDVSPSRPAIQLGELRTPIDNEANLLWWAFLAHERWKHPDGEGWVPCGEVKRLKQFVKLMGDPAWIKPARSEVVQYARGVEPRPLDAALNKFRSRANKAFKKIVEAQFPHLVKQLEIQVRPLGKGSQQRLPIDASRIEIIGLPD